MRNRILESKYFFRISSSIKVIINIILLRTFYPRSSQATLPFQLQVRDQSKAIPDTQAHGLRENY